MDFDTLLDSLDPVRRVQKVKLGGIDAKLYLPREKGRHPAVLFNQGLISGSMRGIANFFPRYITSLGMAVLVPVYEGHLEERLVPGDTEHVVEAFDYLCSHDEVDPERVGMLGFSYGGLLSLIGAEDSRISGKVRYVIDVCGPSDIWGMVPFVCTDGKASRRAKALMGRTFREAVAESLREGRAASDDLTLYKDKWLIDEILSTEDKGALAGLTSELGPVMSSFFDSFSPVQRASRIRTRVLFVHGREDTVVPFEQSERMHEAILAAGGRSELLPIEGLGHILLVENFREFVRYVQSDGRSSFEYIVDFMTR